MRKELCHSLCILLDVRIEAIQPFMRQIIEFMLAATKDEDEVVSLEASEFWSIYCGCQGANLELLQEYVGVLVPMLLEGMIYSDMDIMLIACDDDDEDVPDRPEDIKPRFHVSKHAAPAAAEDDESDVDDW